MNFKITILLFFLITTQLTAQSWQITLPEEPEDVSELLDGSLLVHVGETAYHYSQNGDSLGILPSVPLERNYFHTLEVIDSIIHLVAVDSLGELHFQVPIYDEPVAINMGFVGIGFSSSSGMAFVRDQGPFHRLRVFDQNGILVYEWDEAGGFAPPGLTFDEKRNGNVWFRARVPFGVSVRFDNFLFSPIGELLCFAQGLKHIDLQEKLVEQLASNGASRCGVIEQYRKKFNGSDIHGWVYPCINSLDSILLNNEIPNDIKMLGLDTDGFAVLGERDETYFLTRIDCAEPTISGICLNPVTHLDTLLVCLGEVVVFEGDTLGISNLVFGNYQFNYTDINGCDSILLLNIEQVWTPFNSFTENICQGDVYEFDGNILDSAGLYYFVYQTYDFGCDSTIRINLVIHELIDDFIAIENCDEVTYNDISYTESDIYTQPITDEFGCEGIVTIDISIYESLETFSSITACEPIEWNDQMLNNSGFFTDTLMTQNGCDSLVELDFILTELDNTIFQDGNILNAVATNVDYQWTDCNGNPIPDATNASFEPDDSGSYAVEISDGECTTTSECIDFIISNTTQIGFTSFKSYPNPTTENLWIDFEETIDQLKVSCYDIHGRQILEQEFQYQQFVTLNLLDFPNGLYLIQLMSGEFSETVKLVKK